MRGRGAIPAMGTDVRRAGAAGVPGAAAGARPRSRVAYTPRRDGYATEHVSAETSTPVSAETRGRRPRAVALGLILLASPLCAPLAAQSRIDTSIDTARATVGDRITLTVTIEHPQGTRVAWPDSLDLAPFEVLDAQAAPPVQADGSARSAATFTLAAFELGELEIPSFDVEVVGADGETETLSTDAWGVEVVSVGVDESGEIRDIRGPLSIPMSLLRLVLLALGPLLLIALLYTIARRLRSRTEAPEPARPALERPAHEIALEALAALEGSGMLERGEVKAYHIEVSEILRSYVERRYRVDALEMTTREVLLGLERAQVDGSFREGLSVFLDQCDMVKFAKVRPGPDQSRQVLELGRRLVQRSVPRVEEAAREAALRGTPTSAAEEVAS